MLMSNYKVIGQKKLRVSICRWLPNSRVPMPLNLTDKFRTNPSEHGIWVFVFINVTGEITQNKAKKQFKMEPDVITHSVKRTSTYHQTLSPLLKGVMMIYSEWGTARVLSTSSGVYIEFDVTSLSKLIIHGARRACEMSQYHHHVRCHAPGFFWLLNPTKYIDIHRTYRSFFFGSINWRFNSWNDKEDRHFLLHIYSVISSRHGWTFQKFPTLKAC